MLRKRITEVEQVVEVIGRPAARYSRQIVTNARGRCAVCDKVADHHHGNEEV